MIGHEGKSMARYENILETIGKTPAVRLNRLAPPGVNVYVKIEAFNPMDPVGVKRQVLAVGRPAWPSCRRTVE